ncbi:hypothetical protein HMN09_01418600 [Mycena chlorophos]|uniref:SMP-30/Gluconolactonase/LRE-like region domain-containing protein n=1 Tax=Mycena chlorophos TaxID=658473 RepID=A0A8H6RXN9_MYCCL|nr:hypothetical protein HMN09_01418600 [Mycena chlorophos]
MPDIDRVSSQPRSASHKRPKIYADLKLKMKSLCPLILALSAAAEYSGTVLYQSPTNLWLENIAARANSHLLITSAESPTLYTVDPRAQSVTLHEVFTFPNATALMGITEYKPDVFAVVVSNLTLGPPREALGTVVIWSVAFDAKTGAVSASPAVSVPLLPNSNTAAPQNAICINGISPLSSTVILGAESVSGAIYAFDMASGSVTSVASSPQWIATTNASAPVQLGINGLKYHDGYAYWSAGVEELFGRVRVSLAHHDTIEAGVVEVLTPIDNPYAVAGQSADDLAFDRAGNAWMAVHPSEIVLFERAANGSWVQHTAAGDASGTDLTTFNGPSAVAFGRGEGQEGILYVTTKTGQLIAVDTTGSTY